MKWRRTRPSAVEQGVSNYGPVTASGLGQVIQTNINAKTVNIFNPRPADGESDSIPSKTFSNIGSRLVSSYVERAALHNSLKAHLHDRLHEQVEQSQVVVVYGLGGAGKTQLVLNYAQEFRNDYTGRFWINTAAKHSADADFEHIYTLLFGPQLGALTAEDRVLAVNNWLAQRPGKWLMVFDNADSIENKDDPSYVEIMTYIPQWPSVHVIITSRSSTVAWMTNLAPVEVKEMEESEALDVFFQSCGLHPSTESAENQREATLIVEELGMLALAITLAGYYIRRTPHLSSDLKLYLPEYRKNRQRLLDQKPNPVIHLYGESVLTTWETSFQSLSSQSKIASNLLLFLAFLDSDDIFLDLFKMPLSKPNPAPNDTTEASASHSHTIGRLLESGAEENPNSERQLVVFNQVAADSNSPFARSDWMTAADDWETRISPDDLLELRDIEDSFGVLYSFSLVRWQSDPSSYSFHKLVHAWGHDRLSPAEKKRFGLAALEFLTKVVSSCGPDPTVKRRLVRHIMTNFPLLQAIQPEFLEWEQLYILELLRVLAAFLRDTGHVTQVLQLLRYIVAISALLRGPRHRYTLHNMGLLALALQDAGKLQEAASIQKDIIENYRRILGDEHQDTILAMGNLATTLFHLGQGQDAASIAENVLEQTRRIQGEDHPKTIAAMLNLAAALSQQGTLPEAASIKKEVLEKRRRILGDEDPDTILAMSNMALTSFEQGELHEAESMQRKVLERRARILGVEHPQTLLAMGNLAITLYALGKIQEAESMGKEVLEKSKRILDDDHPATATAMSNFAAVLYRQGNLQEAKTMQKEVLEKRRTILGDEHPDTIKGMNNLAATLHDLRELKEAASMKEIVVEKWKRKLGDDHPHTITALGNQACTLHALGKLKDAESMKREVLEKRIRILGDNHLDTIKAMDNLSGTLYKREKLQEAIKISEDALNKARRVLPTNHPTTINITNNLDVYVKAAASQSGTGPKLRLHLKRYINLD